MARGRQAGDVDDVLDADRHAVQRSADMACGDLTFRGARGIQRGVGIQTNEGVQRRVEPRDARKQRLRQFDRGKLARGERPRGFGGAKPVQLPPRAAPLLQDPS